MRNSVLAAALAVSTLPAFSYADDQLYFGVGIGKAAIESNFDQIRNQYSGVNDSARVNDDNSTFEVFGGIQFDEHFALEAGYVMLGDIVAKQGADSTDLFSSDGYTLTGLLRKDVNEYFSVFGKLGAYFWAMSDAAGAKSLSDAGFDLTYGVGTDINLFGDNTRRMRIQWNRYNYDDVVLDHADVVSISALMALRMR